jgi:ADP-ribosyl-[dinitrogen reductase] hydrolase
VGESSLQDRYQGVLVGIAVGDALGATVEFMSRAEVRERYGVHREIIGGGWLGLPPGEVTDDTQMALCIARSIAAQGGFQPADVAAHFVAWYRSNPPDIGNTTRRSLEYLAAGLAWDVAGQRTHRELRPRDASNGSLMRCAPVALYTRRDAAANVRHSADSSRITHANPSAIDACVAFNAAIAALLDDPDADFLAAAIEVATTTEVQAALHQAPLADPEHLDAGGHVLSTLRAAVWAVTAHDDFEEAVVAAVNLGQDADTTGAVAGALAGARWGVENIPNRWRNLLLGHDELVALSDRLLELSTARR